MTIVLYQQDFWEMLDEGLIHHQSNSNSHIYEESIKASTKYFHWQAWSMPLRSGLRIRTYEITPIDNLIEISEHGNDSKINLSFFLKGNTKTVLQGLTNSADEVVGHNYLEFSPEIKEIDKYAAGQKIFRVQIKIDPTKFFSDFDTNQLQYLPCELQKFVDGSDVKPFHHQGITTPEMQLALQQILNCPFQGAMKSLYLEAKAIELMTLQFSQFIEPVSPAKQPFHLALDDVDRIYQAKEIIIHNLQSPPSLLELSRQVSLNDHKLKQGFRQIFGTTVFGYLHDYRMQQAYMLLATGQMKVKEAAQAVGYASPSSFNSAFKKKFGDNPKAYQVKKSKE
ncbi:MAG: AraC family transcriptional regulator [Nodularia sp. (in: Bacteria)]|nr:MAG: AraC family transcriptional regulator [Nodularia sp. (in: cyanobacteria)]